MAYDIHELKLIGFKIKTLLNVRLEHQPGDHGCLKIEADLGEEGKDYSIQEARDGQRVLLRGVRKEKEETLFCGIITELDGKSVGNSYHIRITAYTYSYLMDIKRRCRSFQDTFMTMGTLLSKITGEYGGECQILFADRALEEIAVQYNETDWEFMKRMLSVWNIPLVASEVREGIHLYAGVAGIPTKMDINSVEGAEKLSEEKAYWMEKGVEIEDDEFIQYHLRLNSRAVLYSQVDYRKRSWIVSKLVYETIGGRLYPLVVLRKKSGIREKSIFPMELVGSALEGEILQVKGEKVQIHLTIDDESEDCYWFPFSTPSASADGSGWYYMPEPGDKVRVYFPTKHTREVIAISAVSTYEAPGSMRKESRRGIN
ncbi:MAG: contractile injection system protein, VgrG/Pvc8 family [Lachnospiraceae bacterium]